MRLGFEAGAISERGTSSAVFDYATGCQDVLGHEVAVFYNPARSLPAAVEKFRSRVRLVTYQSGDDLLRVSAQEKLDLYYRLISGERQPVNAEANAIGNHVVFRHFDPHGDVYAYVSQWLADWMTGGAAPHVPHIVDLPEPEENWREQLGIPKNGFVVGRYGGFDQFNLSFAKEAVRQALERRSDLYFLFVNTERFCDHERVLHMPAVYSNEDKASFIGTCDVGLNAKKIGESFGLATAEFMALGKPVFSWAGGKDQNHVGMTPRKSWLYNGRRDLLDLLVGYHPDADDQELSRQSVEQYRPQAVMKQFQNVFLSGSFKASDLSTGQLFGFHRLLQSHALRARYKALKALYR